MEMIKANGFSRTQICHWTFKVCIFRVYKCAGRPERRRLQAGSTVELGHGVPQLSGAEQKIPSSAFQRFPITLSHTRLLYLEPHRSIQKRQSVPVPSTLPQCAYSAGWGFCWPQHLSREIKTKVSGRVAHDNMASGWRAMMKPFLGLDFSKGSLDNNMLPEIHLVTTAGSTVSATIQP